MARETEQVRVNPFAEEALATEKTKRLSDAAALAAAAPAARQLRDAGYVIFEDLLDARKLREVREAFRVMHANRPMGDTDFAGFRTKRHYNLVARTRVLDELFLHPRVVAAIEAHLDDQIQLSIASSVEMYPGETAQPFHRDDAYYPIARPHMPLSVNTMWAIDDFTADNGATLLIPGSHRSADAEPDAGAPVTRAVMRAGSVLVWDGSLFHAGGANASDAPRLGVTVVYCRAWLRQQENQFLGVPPTVARTLPRPLQKLIGYWVANNLLGYVDDASPRRLLE